MRNKSVTEAIREEHVEVGHYMGELRELLAAEPPDWDRLGPVFESFRERLRRHFELEEQDYLPHLAPDDATRSRERKELLAEHGHMREELDAVRLSLARRSRRGLARRVEKLLSHLASHEHRENQLLQSAILDETGGGD